MAGVSTKVVVSVNEDLRMSSGMPNPASGSRLKAHQRGKGLQVFSPPRHALVSVASRRGALPDLCLRGGLYMARGRVVAEPRPALGHSSLLRRQRNVVCRLHDGCSVGRHAAEPRAPGEIRRHRRRVASGWRGGPDHVEPCRLSGCRVLLRPVSDVLVGRGEAPFLNSSSCLCRTNEAAREGRSCSRFGRGLGAWGLGPEALQEIVLHGAGAHFAPSASFLKCVLVTKSWLRYIGSLTMVVTTSHSSPLGAAKR